MYKLKLHKNLGIEKWSTFNRGKQLLMIANEINRAKNWMQKCDSEEVMNSYNRAFELLDLTISVINEEHMLRELLRFREILGFQYISEKKDLEINAKLLKVLISLNKGSYNLLNPL
ncbi:hypothetical protein KAX35_09610 [candidate division WOR-3 bacterium]|nr:hypothetical protein [candidate division WOR-3 bacterium]